MQKEKCGMENHERKTRNGKSGSGKTKLTVYLVTKTLHATLLKNEKDKENGLEKYVLFCRKQPSST